ncbi:MAG: DUF898 family protein, partial [Xanthobacteraceae bacterium]
LFAFFFLGTLIDWNTLDVAMAQGDQATLAFIEASPGFRAAVGTAFLCIAIAAIAAILLYPLFQAVSLRWWISGLRFGDLAVTSRLKTGQVYRVYLRFVLYILLLILLTAVAGVSACSPYRSSSARATIQGSPICWRRSSRLCFTS